MRVKISTRDNYVVSLYSELSRRYMYSYVLLNLNCNRQLLMVALNTFENPGNLRDSRTRSQS